MSARVRWRLGLVSVTFRELVPAQIVDLARRAELTAVEWGGDIHAPAGDLRRARDVRGMTIDAGLDVAAYGSYYRAGASAAGSFREILDTAAELGASTIRVWAGITGSAATDDDARRRVVEDSRRIADLASRAGIVVAYEFHSGTLADSAEATLALIAQVGRPNVKTLWQPTIDSPAEDCAHALALVLPHLSHIHVFHWWPGTTRRPLSAGSGCWPGYLRVPTPDTTRFALLEFVKNDDPAQLLDDARTIRRWLDDLNDDQNV